MNCLFKVYLIKRHALHHVLESLYLWESLEDKENNHSDIRYRSILLWKRWRDGGRDMRQKTLFAQDSVQTRENWCGHYSRNTDPAHTHPHIFISFSFSFLLISAGILSYRISDDYWQKSNKLMLIKMMFVDKNIRDDNWVKRSWKWRIKRLWMNERQ